MTALCLNPVLQHLLSGYLEYIGMICQSFPKADSKANLGLEAITKYPDSQTWRTKSSVLLLGYALFFKSSAYSFIPGHDTDVTTRTLSPLKGSVSRQPPPPPPWSPACGDFCFRLARRWLTLRPSSPAHCCARYANFILFLLIDFVNQFQPLIATYKRCRWVSATTHRT